jgi:hypothetical protein
MGRGGYLGGSTIFGRWSDTRDFAPHDRPDQSAFPSKYGPLTKRKRKARLAAEQSEAADKLARDLDLNRDEALQYAGRPKLPAKLQARAIQLKALIAEGFLLPTGRPNPEHPQLKGWVSSIKKGKNERPE